MKTIILHDNGRYSEVDYNLDDKVFLSRNGEIKECVVDSIILKKDSVLYTLFYKEGQPLEILASSDELSKRKPKE